MSDASDAEERAAASIGYELAELGRVENGTPMPRGSADAVVTAAVWDTDDGTRVAVLTNRDDPTEAAEVDLLRGLGHVLGMEAALELATGVFTGGE